MAYLASGTVYAKSKRNPGGSSIVPKSAWDRVVPPDPYDNSVEFDVLLPSEVERVGDRVQVYYPERCYGGWFAWPECLDGGWTEVEVYRDDPEYRLRSASGILLIAASTVLLITGAVGVKGAGATLFGYVKGRRA